MSAEQVKRAAQTITIGGRGYMKFIPYPMPVLDGTVRCFRCGQIDEPAYHDDAICRASPAGVHMDGAEVVTLTKGEVIMLRAAMKIGRIYPRGRHVSLRQAERAVARGLLLESRLWPGSFTATDAGVRAICEQDR